MSQETNTLIGTAGIFYAGCFATAIVTSLASNALSNVGMTLPPDVADAAEGGAVTVEQACAAQAAFSEKLSSYFVQRSKGQQNVEFVITREECEGLMQARSAPARTAALHNKL